MSVESDLFKRLRTNVLILTGAGASKPLGMPLMREFHDLVSGKLNDEERELLRKISLVHLEETEEKREVTPDLEALLALIERYRGFYDILFKDKNFGYHTSEEWGRWAELEDKGLLAPEPSTDMSMSRESPDYLAQAYVRKEKLEAIDTLLRDLMFEEYGKSIDASKLDELYSPLFGVIRKHTSQNVIPIFTTNYDMAIEGYAQQSNIDLETGFESTPTGNVWKPGRFIQFRASTGKQNIILFKLHGSLTCHEKGDDIISTFLPVRNPAGYSSAIIYPTQTKEYPDEEPFRTAYNYLRGCFAIAKAVIVIGYSFRDRGIRRILEDTLEHNRKLLFILVCGQNEERWKVLTQKNPKNYRIIPHYFDFASNGAPYLKELDKALMQ